MRYADQSICPITTKRKVHKSQYKQLLCGPTIGMSTAISNILHKLFYLNNGCGICTLLCALRLWTSHTCRFHSFVSHMWHPCFPLIGIKKYLTNLTHSYWAHKTSEERACSVALPSNPKTTQLKLFQPWKFYCLCMGLICCLGVFSLAAQKPQLLCLELIISTST